MVSAVVVNAALAQVTARSIYRVKHAEALVAVDPKEGGGFNNKVVLCGPGF